jgi:hypothetical protein
MYADATLQVQDSQNSAQVRVPPPAHLLLHKCRPRLRTVARARAAAKERLHLAQVPAGHRPGGVLSAAPPRKRPAHQAATLDTRLHAAC